MKKKEALILIQILLVILVIVALAVHADAGTKTLEFAWEQPAADTQKSDFGGWKLYRQNGAAWDLVATIPYAGAQQQTYTAQQSLQAPDAAETAMTFALTAYDKSGNESARSNTVTTVIDFLAPAIPINLKITVVPAM